MPETLESGSIRGISLIRSMALVAIIAVDFAAVSSMGRMHPNPGIALMVVVLEVGLWRVTARAAEIGPEWMGFQFLGWAYVLFHMSLARPIWQWSSRFFLKTILGSTVFMTQNQRWVYLAFASCVQLAIALSLAMLGGAVAGRIVRLRGGGRSL
jgi:hypothetical protein